jgi:sulfur-oxidizing protein SoxY
MPRLMMAALLVAAAPALAAGSDEPDRVERWRDIAGILFEDAAIAPTETAVTLEAPARALDAALVPITVRAEPGTQALSLVVDENPGPVAAAVTFGPAGDPRLLGLRVRVEGYSNVHAVATRADGSLVENAVFVKAAGGCSAPVAGGAEAALADLGEMRMRFGGDAPEGAARATLLLRHPNFNGMQMDQVSRHYTPARYLTALEIRRGDALVLAMESDISLAADPAIEFLYRPDGGAEPFHVAATDSDGTIWTQDFAAPEVGN